ncbi:tyrosine-type recombinase/integrase [Deinococcus terrestris]|uniref:tyrosine-type recombinase/integrase n=1 Tax=Deinococcus terrestris TaxID=2651870 RepID=UPI00188312EA|nr:tyrosine-type recombinase/integrase [Deinococcus terrestris]
MFTGLSGVRLNLENLKRYLDAYCDEAQIRRIPVHGLRHTLASLALARNRDQADAISKNLGHSKLSTTLYIYRTVHSEERRQAAVNLSDLLPIEKPVGGDAA